MMISTKGRYSIRILLDLAIHRNGEYIPMKDVAERQGISLKYIERILPVLKENGLIDSVHGKGGGYKLTREPDQYTLWEILRLTEGDLAPVACLKDGAPSCDKAAECRTLPVWKNYYKMTVDYFSKITLADLMDVELPENYVI
ncbi:MAG: RrF2 family transcriptional regulator [Candidatus Avispirillum sp.]